MNEQEMQFADPDWQPGKQASAQNDTAGMSQPAKNNFPNDPGRVNPGSNAFPHSSYNSSYSPYEQGYKNSSRQAHTPLAPLPISATDIRQTQAYPPRNAHRRSLWWVWLIAIFTFILIINGMSGFRSSRSSQFPNFNGQRPFSGSNANSSSPYTYQSTTATQVQIYDPSGSIVIQAGDSNTGEITARTDSADPNAVSFTESNNIVTISLNNPSAENNGTVEVTLPQNITMLNLTGTANDIEVDDFTGSIIALTDAGNITLNDDALSGSTTLNTDTGSIDMEKGSATGTTIIKSSSGTITLNTDLSGQVTASTGEDGEIQFSGTLDQNGTYHFITEDGDIDLTLPADTSMQVEHITGTGGSYQNDFNDATGASPRASVELQTNNGAIGIHNQDN